MSRRYIRNNLTKGTNLFSVNKMSKNEQRQIIMWLFRLCDYSINMGHNEEYQNLYNILVHNFGLEEHSRKVTKAMIELAKKEKRLTIAEDIQSHCHPYNMVGSLDEIYKEDTNLYEISGNWQSENTDQINQIRAVFANGSDAMEKLVAYTFFYSSNSESKVFKIPSKKASGYKIPKDFLAMDKDYSKVKKLKDAFSLDDEEACLLNVIYLTHVTGEIFNLMNTLMHQEWNRYELYCRCADMNYKKIKSILRNDKKLISFGLIDKEGGIDQDVIDCIFAEDINMYFSDVLREDNKRENYKLDSFSVKSEDTELALRLLNNEGSTNILLYGAPGSGKTEYARSLVKSSGHKPLIFKNELEVDERNGGTSSKALSRLNCLLSLQKEDSVIIVDEAESILSTGTNFYSMIFGGEDCSSSKKGTVNTMMENSRNKVIWILNYTNPLDESTLRRFTYSIHFNEMTSVMLKKIADTKLNTLKMSSDLRNELVDLCGKYHVTGASVDNMVKTVKGMDLKLENKDRIISDVRKVLEANSTLLYGKPKMREQVKDSYDLSILNTSVPAEEIVEMVQNAHEYAEENALDGGDAGIRILFYGLSGTGKTELARYIAEKLNKKIILKRASDILGMYVGESEKNIRKAFAEAEATGDILLFDEADSFFANRANATRSWERTQVNEFLTQMEEFSGILICTTNLRNIMDPAMQRRFHILSEFKPMNDNGVKKLLKRFFKKYTFTDEMVDELVSYNSVTPGDFGSLAGKIRFKKPEDVTAQKIIDELCAIQEEKDSNHSIGFAV